MNCECGAEMWQEKVGEIKFFACPNCNVVYKLVEVKLDNEILSKGKKSKVA